VTKKHPTNLAASVHARLLNAARAQQRPFHELLQYYAMERMLFRLSVSQHRDQFVLKGALMLRLWGGPDTRSTKDIDLLGRSTATVDELVLIIRECLGVSVPPDGLDFDSASVGGVPIRRDARYLGVRITLKAALGGAAIVLQIDVGFGDVITPSAQPITYPPLLDFPAPELQGYTPETSIAEKLEAMVTLDIGNSRMKDFFDIALLARTRTFDAALLAQAIGATFRRRGTPLPSTLPVGLSAEFAGASGKAQQWAGFLRKLRVADARTLGQIIDEVRAFLWPLVEALVANREARGCWSPGGPWSVDG